MSNLLFQVFTYALLCQRYYAHSPDAAQLHLLHHELMTFWQFRLASSSPHFVRSANSLVMKLLLLTRSSSFLCAPAFCLSITESQKGRVSERHSLQSMSDPIRPRILHAISSAAHLSLQQRALFAQEAELFKLLTVFRP